MSFREFVPVTDKLTKDALATVVNAAFLFFETSKLWALTMLFCRIDGKPKD